MFKAYIVSEIDGYSIYTSNRANAGISLMLKSLAKDRLIGIKSSIHGLHVNVYETEKNSKSASFIIRCHGDIYINSLLASNINFATDQYYLDAIKHMVIFYTTTSVEIEYFQRIISLIEKIIAKIKICNNYKYKIIGNYTKISFAISDVADGMVVENAKLKIAIYSHNDVYYSISAERDNRKLELSDHTIADILAIANDDSSYERLQNLLDICSDLYYSICDTIIAIFLSDDNRNKSAKSHVLTN